MKTGGSRLIREMEKARLMNILIEQDLMILMRDGQVEIKRFGES